jgi:hypothetical protein
MGNRNSTHLIPITNNLFPISWQRQNKKGVQQPQQQKNSAAAKNK